MAPIAAEAWRRAAGWPLVAGCVAPLVVSAYALVGDRWFPSGDIALLELVTRDIGHHAVLVGPYSRWDWHHPGPLIYYALFAPYHLTGESSMALPLTALTINAASIAGMALVARRLAGRGFMLATVLALALLVRSFGAEFVRSPWNPSITVLPLGLLTYLTWATTCGVRWALPIAAVVATFLAQTHIGYVAIALPLLGVGAAALLVHAVTTGRAAGDAPPSRAGRRTLGRPIAVTLGALVVMWLPPIVDEVTNEPGNLSSIVDYFRTTDEPTHSLLDGLNAMTPQFAAVPAWITGDRSTEITGEPTALADPALPVLALVVVAAAAFVLRRGPVHARRFIATVAIVIALGVVSIARTPGPLYMYRLDWIPLVGMLSFVSAALAVPLLVPPSTLRRLRPPALAVAFISLVAVATASTVDAIRADVPNRSLSDAIGDLAPGVLADLPNRDGQVVFRRGTDFIAGSVGRGLELELERAGVWTVAGGEEDPDRPVRVQYLIVTNALAVDLATDPNVALVARTGQVDPDRREPGEHLVAIYRPTP